MALGYGRAGALNRLITIERSVDVQDATGQPIPTWQRLCRAWAAVDSSDAAERFQNAREVGHKWRVFTIRWRDDIDFNQRIVYEGEYYNIRKINEIERRGRSKFLDITAESIEGADGQ